VKIDYHAFVHLVFIGSIALFPVVNPIGSVFMVSPHFSSLSDAEKKRAVKKITLNAFFLCLTFLFAGHWILQLFGLSIPVIQLAGGIMICKMGWQSISSDKTNQPPAAKTEAVPTEKFTDVEGKLFYPLTFPITTGAGTISVLFTLSAHAARASFMDYLVNIGAILVAIIFMCMLVYIIYNNTNRIFHLLGENGQLIIDRVTAFLIFCVGLQIAASGIMSIIKK
jgi:multiple antibiotic resistance protein